MSNRVQIRGSFWFLLVALMVGHMGLLGCSSLPKQPVKSSSIDQRAASFQELGNKQYRAGNLAKAGAYFGQALAVYGSIDAQSGVSAALAGLGRAQLGEGDLDLAVNSFQRSLRAAQGLQRPDLVAQSLGGLAAVELRGQNPQAAHAWLAQAMKLPLAAPGSARAVLLHDLGAAYWQQGKLAEAEASFRQALAMHESLRDPVGIAADCYSLALLHQGNGDLVQAMKLAKRALANDKLAENPAAIAQDLMLLGEVAGRSGDSRAAGGYYQRARLAWEALGRSEEVEGVSVLVKELATERIAEKLESP